ncbi:hypothetical protein RAB80_015677 [Fusarium oxysporum f. sp. vasinfectum]|nr:hypothetical protein RAB80_015677 [Fusarium oxysporum f. sp. vasinfectum]KAK2694464.1 hypothetical protein QWA68_005778 [Fusarium oxysporum]KAK2926048.1 hypothetical protein FoTM2_014417 [Fusarium oxysporum f. sp. vasinfectum]
MPARIRATCIPIAFAASEDHPHLSMWLQVSFTQNRVVDIWRGDSTFSGHETDTMSGLRVWRDVTVGFDITGLTELLSCPRQFRKVNPYQAKFIELVHRDSIEQSMSQTPTMMGMTLAGLPLHKRTGEKGSWFEDFFKNAITVSLGFVPGVGPLLSIALSLGWTAVVNPDRFILPELFEDDVRKNSTEIRALTRESFWNMGPAEALVEVKKLKKEEKKQQKVSGEVQSYFQQAHEVLLVDEAKYDNEAGADEEPVEVLVEVSPRDAPANGHAVEAVE